MATALEHLLLVQEHDSAIDHLRHRRATLPERAVLIEAEALIRELEAPIAEVRGRHDVVSRDVKRLEDEAGSAAAKVGEVETSMYSGSVTSPRELQAMQGEVDQLRRHQRALEDRELELMEGQEAIDGELSALAERVGAAEQRARDARAAVEEQEGVIDAEIGREMEARRAAASDIPANLLAVYDGCRAATRGVGVARLVGNTCQGCRLTIPSTEVARIRKAGPDGDVAHCDNCGAILVPSS
jgi:predicted  nucleic acid-binding Zn-ribbon protein